MNPIGQPGLRRRDTSPTPSRVRSIRVSGTPNSIAVYGNFPFLTEEALHDGWLSQYEYSALEKRLPGKGFRAISDDALDLLEVLRQVRFSSGYRPQPNQVDDLYNLGFYGASALPPIGGVQFEQIAALRVKRDPNDLFVSHVNEAQTTGLLPFAGMTIIRQAAVRNAINVRLARISNDRNLAPDDRTVLLAIQIASLMNWLVLPPPLAGVPPPPPAVATVSVGGVAINVPALSPAEQTAFNKCLRPVSHFDRGQFGCGFPLICFRQFAQPIFDCLFNAGNLPAGWQWPVL